jgi:hypothetical protein
VEKREFRNKFESGRRFSIHKLIDLHHTVETAHFYVLSLLRIAGRRMLKLVKSWLGKSPPVDGEFLRLAATKLCRVWQIGESGSKPFSLSTTIISPKRNILTLKHTVLSPMLGVRALYSVISVLGPILV